MEALKSICASQTFIQLWSWWVYTGERTEQWTASISVLMDDILVEQTGHDTQGNMVFRIILTAW